MAEGRFVSKSIATDWELNRVVSFEADYLFRACIPFIDREGRLTGHPGEVKALVCPLRENMTAEVVDRCLGELAAAKLVLWYEVDGKPTLWFKGFSTHQKGLRADREAASKLPSPQSPNLQRLTTLLRSNSNKLQATPAEVKGSEVKGSQEQIHGAGRNVEKSEYSHFDLLEAAKRECGMGTWTPPKIGSASGIIASWISESRKHAEIWAAIHGSRLMVDAGKVNWLTPQKPYGLEALKNTGILFDQGDGHSARPFFDCAVEAFYADDVPRVRVVSTGPSRVRVDSPLQALGGSSA